MIITAWRVEKEEYLKESSSGNGAKKGGGGRWNRTGTPVVYSADSKALAVLEMLIHILDNESVEDRFVIPITFDDSLVFHPNPHDLPENWWTEKGPIEAKEFGTQWVKMKTSAVLCVPSAVLYEPRVVVHGGLNYILNPKYPGFKKLISFGEPLALRIDSRLRKK